MEQNSTEQIEKIDVEEEDLCEGFGSEDHDVCDGDEIEVQFSNRYIEVQKLKVTDEGATCSSLLADNHSSNIASVLSNRNIVVIDRESFKITETYKPHKKEITDIRFSPSNSNLIYTSCLDGKIKLWDLRSNTIEKTINTNTEENKMPVTTFDISSHEKVICAGTELVGEDSFILFWDIRKDKMLGGYWESHSDDIKCVRFNPNSTEILASAGCDGLINIFDISKKSEDNAFTYCLNTEDIANSFCWRNEDNKSNILAYTDIHSIQLWDIEEGAPSHTFSREKITKALKRNVTYECYPIPICSPFFDRNPIVLAGSGLEYENSGCLRTLRIDEKSGCLEPHGLLIRDDDKSSSSIVQVASFSKDFEDLITVREDGIISLWKNKLSANEKKSKSVKNRRKYKKIKPY